MMGKGTDRMFMFGYLLIILIDLIVLSIPDLSHVRIASKPLILSSLIIYFIRSGLGYSSEQLLVLLALIFSLIGDILLLFEDRSSFFFIGGLISFLMVHIVYSITFLRHKRKSKVPYLMATLLLLIGAALFTFVKNGLGELLMPVIVYTLVILTMVFLAYCRDKKISNTSYDYIFYGAVLFMVSDSVLAIDKFRFSFNMAPHIIILTYALAQYFIVRGLMIYYSIRTK